MKTVLLIFYAVIALDYAFTGRHFSRLIIGNVTFYLTTMDGGNAGLAGALTCRGVAVFRN
jgi:hypothetical protein